MSELLLEIYSTEIPGLMQEKAAGEYEVIFRKLLTHHQLHYGTLEIFVGPRRLTLYIDGLSQFIEASFDEIKGPKVSIDSVIIERFCASHNISIDVLLKKNINNQDYYIYNKPLAQITVYDKLIEILPTALLSYTWPKTMVWGNHNIRWIRPIKNILCLFDNKILPIELKPFIGNDITYGHHFMANNAIKITNFIDYKTKLKEHHVILSHTERRDLIQEAINNICTQYNLTCISDDKLLQEVTGLVEYPVVMIGQISEKFLELPSEILIASMRNHQRYFALFKDNKLAPYFIFVSNIESSEPDIIIKGNEKVLEARLADAMFFYKYDIEHKVKERCEKLKNITFHAKLGSLYDKQVRLEKISDYLLPDNKYAREAAMISKNDLTSEIVGEFPELQGIMGYYYALNDGSNIKIAEAIRDQYKIASNVYDLPSTLEGSILAIADRIDSLIGLMIVGETATSSKDPYGLRRNALVIIKIIVNSNLTINIKSLIRFVIALYDIESDETKFNLIYNFIIDRAKHYFGQVYKMELVNILTDFDDIYVCSNILNEIEQLLANEHSQILLNNYKRITNIIGKGPISILAEDKFTSEFEHQLFKITKQIKEYLSSESRLEQNIHSLFQLNKPLNNFFDNILVKSHDIDLTNNRFSLLYYCRSVYLQVLDFDKLCK